MNSSMGYHLEVTQREARILNYRSEGIVDTFWRNWTEHLMLHRKKTFPPPPIADLIIFRTGRLYRLGCQTCDLSLHQVSNKFMEYSVKRHTSRVMTRS